MSQLLFTCDCGKEYKHKSSLNTHKKKCGKLNIPNKDKKEEEKTQKEKQKKKIYYMNLMHEIMENNRKLKETLMEQRNEIKEKINYSKTNENNTTIESSPQISFKIICDETKFDKTTIDYVQSRLDQIAINFNKQAEIL